VVESQVIKKTQLLIFVPDILEMLMTSCSTSSLLFLRRRKDRLVLGKGTGLNDGLEILEPVSSELWSSISEAWCEAEMAGLQVLSVALGTGLQVTRIKI
jgi:hypothetical protein